MKELIKKQTKRILLVSIFLVIILKLAGQSPGLKGISQNGKSEYLLRSTLGNNGLSKAVTSNAGTYFIQQSIGQASVIGTYSKSNFTIRQGFLQPPNQANIRSINIIETNLKANLYPNPFQQSINVSFDEAINNDMSVVIYHISGRIIFSEKYPAHQLINVPLGNIAKGDYILKITTDNKQLVAKLIKQ